MIKAIIFDMDGVLIEAKDWHYEALNKALALFGFSISRFDHLTAYDGLPTKTKLERLSIETGFPRELHGFVNEMKQEYTIEMVHAFCRPTFCHEYALSRLKSEGYALAVASNSIRNTVELMMEKSHLGKYLDFQFSNEDVSRPKPDPEIYLKAMKTLGVSPVECLIVEDNENGIRAATSSGAHLLQVADVSEVNYSNISRIIRQIDKGIVK